MKKQLLLIIGLMISASIIARPLTKKAAKENALSFLYSNHNTGRMFVAAGLNQSVLNPVELTSGEDAYFIYNIGDHQGFIIVAGDDCAEPILGYSYEGSFDPENIPTNMQNWLDGYALQIKDVRNADLAAPEARKSGIKHPCHLSIPALLTCKWNQDSPFNDKCPDFKDGHKNRPTGCVATAVSQVMYYHKWPREATPEIPGYTYVDDESLGGNGKNKTLETLPSITFDWDNMLDVYKGNSPKKKREAVATLMRYVGQAASMQYCVHASGAHSSDIAKALRTYMDYDKAMRYVDRTSYSDIEWADIIYEELANNRPVLYSGTAPGIGGHQFVCDGYENDFFHFNWGWGGVSDGYFKLNALAPSQQGIGGAGNGMHFSERHHIVIGVQPSVEGSVQPEDAPCIGIMTLEDNPEGIYKKDDQGNVTISINASFGYNAENDATFSIGIGLFDADNKFIGVIKQVERLFEAGYPNPKNNIKGNITITKDKMPADGTYYMRAIVKSQDAEEWSISEKGDKVYFKINVKGSDVTIAQYPYVDVEISDIQFGEFRYQGSEVMIKGVIKNLGDDMSGILYLTHNNVVDSKVNTEISLRSNEVKEVSLTFIPDESGSQSFGFSVNGRLFAAEAEVMLEAGENKNSNLDFLPEKNITSEGNFMDIPVEVTNNTGNNYKSLVRAMLYSRVGFKYTKETTIFVPVEVSGSGKTNVTLHFDNLRFCENYYLAFAYYSNGYEKVYGGVNENTGTPKITFSKYTTADALAYYDETGKMSYKVIAEGETFDIPANACFVEIPNAVSGRTINKSSNPNCIYELKKGVSVSSLDGCNVVKEGVSSQINLTDDNSFYSSEIFTADKLNVSVKVDNELMAIWLPFDPSAANIDGVELKRAESIADMPSSDYMVMPFTAEDENTLYCEFEQNTMVNPCIMYVHPKHVGKNIVFSANDVSLNLGTCSMKGIYYNMFRSNNTGGYDAPVYGFAGNEFSTEMNNPAPFRVYLTSISSAPSKVAVSYPDNFDPAGIEDVYADGEGTTCNVYTIDGVKVSTVVYGHNMLNGLPRGIYIVNGKKYVK